MRLTVGGPNGDELAWGEMTIISRKMCLSKASCVGEGHPYLSPQTHLEDVTLSSIAPKCWKALVELPNITGVEQRSWGKSSRRVSPSTLDQTEPSTPFVTSACAESGFTLSFDALPTSLWLQVCCSSLCRPSFSLDLLHCLSATAQHQISRDAEGAARGRCHCRSLRFYSTSALHQGRGLMRARRAQTRNYVQHNCSRRG